MSTVLYAGVPYGRGSSELSTGLLTVLLTVLCIMYQDGVCPGGAEAGGPKPQHDVLPVEHQA